MRPVLFIATLALVSCDDRALPVAGDSPMTGLAVTTPGEAFPQKTSLQLRAYGLHADGSRVDLTREVTWSSSAPDTIFVTNDGVALLRTAGSAVLSASLGSWSHTCLLTATPAKLINLVVTADETGSVAKGHSLQFRATAYFDDGAKHDVTSQAKWSTTSAAATTDVSGQFVARAEGSATVRAEFLDRSAEQSFNITGPVYEGLFISSPATALRPGDLHQLDALARFSDGSATVLTAECEWSSSDLSVASVSNEGAARGTLVARSAGLASVMAICGSRSATRSFSVINRVAVSLTLSHDLQLERGVEAQVRAEAHYDDGTFAEVTDQVVFGTTEPTIAAVSNAPGFRGLVRAVGEGTATVSGHLGEVSAQLEVLVLAPALQSLHATLPSVRIVPRQRATFAVLGRFTDGSTSNLSSMVAFRSGPQVRVTAGNDELALMGESLGVVNVQAEITTHLMQFQVEVTDALITGVRLELAARPERPGTEKLSAIATWSDGRETDITELAEWTSSNPGAALARNTPGARGFVQVMAGGHTTITSQLGADVATYDFDFTTTP